MLSSIPTLFLYFLLICYPYTSCYIFFILVTSVETSLYLFCHLCCALCLQDSQGDQLIADGTLLFQIKINQSIKLKINQEGIRYTDRVEMVRSLLQQSQLKSPKQMVLLLGYFIFLFFFYFFLFYLFIYFLAGLSNDVRQVCR